MGKTPHRRFQNNETNGSHHGFMGRPMPMKEPFVLLERFDRPFDYRLQMENNSYYEPMYGSASGSTNCTQRYMPYAQQQQANYQLRDRGGVHFYGRRGVSSQNTRHQTRRDNNVQQMHNWHNSSVHHPYQPYQQNRTPVHQHFQQQPHWQQKRYGKQGERHQTSIPKGSKTMKTMSVKSTVIVPKSNSAKVLTNSSSCASTSQITLKTKNEDKIYKGPLRKSPREKTSKKDASAITSKINEPKKKILATDKSVQYKKFTVKATSTKRQSLPARLSFGVNKRKFVEMSASRKSAKTKDNIPSKRATISTRKSMPKPDVRKLSSVEVDSSSRSYLTPNSSLSVQRITRSASMPRTSTSLVAKKESNGIQMNRKRTNSTESKKVNELSSQSDSIKTSKGNVQLRRSTRSRSVDTERSIAGRLTRSMSVTPTTKSASKKSKITPRRTASAKRHAIGSAHGKNASTRTPRSQQLTPAGSNRGARMIQAVLDQHSSTPKSTRGLCVSDSTSTVVQHLDPREIVSNFETIETSDNSSGEDEDNQIANTVAVNKLSKSKNALADACVVM